MIRRVLFLAAALLAAQSFGQSYSLVKQRVEDLRGRVGVLEDGTNSVVRTNDPAYLSVVRTNTPAYTSAVQKAGAAMVATQRDFAVNSISYTNTYWEDLTLSALTLFDPPGNASVAIVSVTTGVYAAEFSVGESGAGIAQTKHAMKAGTAIYPHLHVVGNAAGPATSVWTLVVNSATNSGGTFDRPYSASVTGATAFAQELMLSLPAYTNYLSESAIVGCVVSNVSGATACLLDVDFHYEIDKPGSDNANPFQ